MKNTTLLFSEFIRFANNTSHVAHKSLIHTDKEIPYHLLGTCYVTTTAIKPR